jgi:hypothetical protein
MAMCLGYHTISQDELVDPCMNHAPVHKTRKQGSLPEGRHHHISCDVGSGSLEQTVHSTLTPPSDSDGAGQLNPPSSAQDQVFDTSTRSSFTMLRAVAEILGYRRG